MIPRMAKIDLCEVCAAKLRVILREHGAEAMAMAVGEILCDHCRAKVPGYTVGKTLVTSLKPPPEPRVCTANGLPLGDVEKAENFAQWAIALLHRGYEPCGAGATHVGFAGNLLCTVHAEAARVALRNPDCIANLRLGRGRTEEEIAQIVRPLEDVS